MKKNIYIVVFLLFSVLIGQLQAQTACTPDPQFAGAAPGLYPDSLPPAYGCQFYDIDVTFKLPTDTVVSPVGTVNFEWFEIDTITGFPPGNMQWKSNMFPTNHYTIPQDTFGCVRIWGTPIQLNVPDTFTIHIKVLAKVDALSTPQVTSFERQLIVFPCQDPANCFTKTQNQLCAPSVCTFAPDSSLMFPPNPGISYSWNFGNGQTSTSQYPPTQTYAAGTYYPSFRVIIDTLGYFLNGVNILTTNCTDVTGDPDFYWDMLNGTGGFVIPPTSYITMPPPTITNPIVTGIAGVPVLQNASYTFEVWDDDSGTFGTAPDGCATNGNGSGAGVSFTVTSAGTFTVSNGGLTIQYTITHPMDTVFCTDTIVVAPIPQKPVILPNPNQDVNKLCVGDNITLFANSQASGLTWFLDGDTVGTGNFINANQSGNYVVLATNQFLCESYSDTLNLFFHPKPTINVTISSFVPNVSTTYQANVTPAGANYYYIWKKNNAPVAYTQNFTIMQNEPGIYCVTAVYTTMAACSTTVCVDTILSGINNQSLSITDVSVFPNPTTEIFTVKWESLEKQNVAIVLHDLVGKEMLRRELSNIVGTTNEEISVANFAKGVYLLSIETESGTYNQKVMVE